MATPHVAGVVASYLSLNPSATPAQVFKILNTTATLNSKSSLLPSNTPNRMLYSRFDLKTDNRDVTNAGDWMRALTNKRTGSLPTVAASYYSPSFMVGMVNLIRGLLGTSVEGCDMDLYLQRLGNNSTWTELASSYTYSSIEYVEHKTRVSSARYRFKVYLFYSYISNCSFTLLSNY